MSSQLRDTRRIRRLDAVAFILAAAVISVGLFAILQSPTVRLGCPTIPVGPSATAAGVIVAARGLGWRRKRRSLLMVAVSLAVVVALGAPTWFGIYRLGDMSTAPNTLSVITAVPLLFFTAFAFLPWAIPIAVLVLTVGRDPRKLWSSEGRG